MFLIPDFIQSKYNRDHTGLSVHWLVLAGTKLSGSCREQDYIRNGLGMGTAFTLVCGTVLCSWHLQQRPYRVHIY